MKRISVAVLTVGSGRKVSSKSGPSLSHRVEGKWEASELKGFYVFLLLDARVGHGEENGVLDLISKKVRFWIVLIFFI